MIEFIVLLILFLDILVTFLLISLFVSHRKFLPKSTILRIGIVLAMIGFLGQAIHSHNFHSTNFAMLDDDFPWFFSKDLSLIIFICYVFSMWRYAKSQNSNQ